jgi:hypothetical protein
MSRMRWAKAVDATALLFGYLWYNSSFHSVVTRILF